MKNIVGEDAIKGMKNQIIGWKKILASHIPAKDFYLEYAKNFENSMVRK